MIATKYDDTIAITKICKTHNVLCSKTGWELGWYREQKRNNRKG